MTLTHAVSLRITGIQLTKGGQSEVTKEPSSACTGWPVRLAALAGPPCPKEAHRESVATRVGQEAVARAWFVKAAEPAGLIHHHCQGPSGQVFLLASRVNYEQSAVLKI